MTVAIGGQPIEIYQKIHAEFANHLMDLQCALQELVMFVYDERDEVNAGYMTYMILPLGSLKPPSSLAGLALSLSKGLRR